MSGRCSFGFVKHLQRRLVAISDAQSFRYTNPGPASADIIDGRDECCLELGDRFFGGARIPQRIAAEAHQVALGGRVLGQFDATTRQSERRLEVEHGGLRLGRIEIGGRGIRIVGTIQMLRTQHRVTLVVPCGGGTVKFRAADRQKRRVDSLLHHRVSEQVAVAFWPDKITRDQSDAGILWVFD